MQPSLSGKFSLGSTARSPKEDVMKRNLIGILSLVVISLMVNATGAYAQSSLRANIPFAFKVGPAQLPAGAYEINTANDGSVLIRNRESRKGALTTVRSEDPRQSGPKLVFHHLGGQYFLAEIWRGAGSSSMAIPTSKQEKSLEKELKLASGQSTVGEEILIALN
jgi:hypothetical protein